MNWFLAIIFDVSKSEIMKSAIELYRELSLQDSGYFELQIPVITETEKAICFDNDHSHLASQQKQVWIPKSQMQIIDLGSDSGSRYFVKNWLYKKLK